MAQNNPTNMAALLKPSEGRIPPNDLDAEAAILSACFLQPSTLNLVQPLLSPDDFYSNANRTIYEAQLALNAQGGKIDVVTVKSWLADHDRLNQCGGAVYLGQIVDAVPAIAHAEDYVRIVKGKRRMRAAIAESQRTAALAYSYEGEPQEFLNQAESRMSSLARAEIDKNLVHVSSAISQAVERMQFMHQSGVKVTGCTTGFTRLDNLTGGYQPTDLIIIAARPGMGKTAYLCSSAVSCAATPATIFDPKQSLIPEENTVRTQPRAAVIFSIEMPREQLALRLLCMEARVDTLKARLGDLSKEDWTKLIAAAGWLSKLPMFIDDTTVLTTSDLRAKVMRAKAVVERQGMVLGLACLDYLQIMTNDDKTLKNRTEIVGGFARGVKQVARQSGVPIMAAAQLKREADDGGKGRRPVLSDLRESGDIEQQADLVAFLYREEYYDKDDPEVAGLCEIDLAKHRNGPTGAVKVRYTKYCTRFDNLAGEEEWEDLPG